MDTTPLFLVRMHPMVTTTANICHWSSALSLSQNYRAVEVQFAGVPRISALPAGSSSSSSQDSYRSQRVCTRTQEDEGTLGPLQYGRRASRDLIRNHSTPHRLQSIAKSASLSAACSTLPSFHPTCCSLLLQFCTSAAFCWPPHIPRRDPCDISYSALTFISLFPTSRQLPLIVLSRALSCPFPALCLLPSARHDFIASMLSTSGVDLAMCIIVFRTFQSIASKSDHMQELYSHYVSTPEPQSQRCQRVLL
jgi:hypothetical protein